MKNLKGTAGDTSIILFGTISGGITAELTGEDGALRKCPVDIFSEWASMRRESQGAATGMAVSALNHVAHRMAFEIGKDPNTPDLTKEFNNQLRKTRKHFKTLNEKYQKIMEETLQYGGDVRAIGMMKLGEFYKLVKTNGDFDLKNLKGSIFSNEELAKIGGKAYYNNSIFEGQDFGNFNFGVAAKAYGYSLGFIKGGAGAYQIWSGTSSWSYFRSWFDDPRDTRMIERGFNLKWK